MDTWDSQQTTVWSLAIGLLPVKIRSLVISLPREADHVEKKNLLKSHADNSQ